MTKFEVTCYDLDSEHVTEPFILELPSLREALLAVAEKLPSIPGNAHIVELVIEELSDEN